MSNNKLVAIKVIHSLIWLFFATSIFYVLYCGIFNKVSFITWILIGFVFLETFVLLFFKWRCPLTLIARKYSNSNKDNFDIYLPNWIAKHNKLIFSIIFTTGLILVIYRTII